MTDKPHMTLPNGDVLYEGDYGVTRCGRKVGPARFCADNSASERWDLPWPGGPYCVSDKGKSCLGYEEDDVIAKWVDPDTPKIWRDMTDAEKGALLLAHHEGKAIEYFSSRQSWRNVDGCGPNWFATIAYRIKPEPKRPRKWWIDPCNGEVCDAPVRDYIHVREVMGDD